MSKLKPLRAGTFLIILAALAFIMNSSAEDRKTEDLKDRMKARLPIIEELKAKGVIGENNKGYLEFIGSIQNEDIVKAENDDRKEVYSIIAGDQGTTLDIVGKRRAEKIADKADPGEWLQDKNGNWYKKNK